MGVVCCDFTLVDDIALGQAYVLFFNQKIAPGASVGITTNRLDRLYRAGGRVDPRYWRTQSAAVRYI